MSPKPLPSPAQLSLLCCLPPRDSWLLKARSSQPPFTFPLRRSFLPQRRLAGSVFKAAYRSGAYLQTSGEALITGIRAIPTVNTAISAGVIPGSRSASPKVRGRRSLSTCIASRFNARSAAKSKSDGMTLWRCERARSIEAVCRSR